MKTNREDTERRSKEDGTRGNNIEVGSMSLAVKSQLWYDGMDSHHCILLTLQNILHNNFSNL